VQTVRGVKNHFPAVPFVSLQSRVARQHIVVSAKTPRTVYSRMQPKDYLECAIHRIRCMFPFGSSSRLWPTPGRVGLFRHFYGDLLGVLAWLYCQVICREDDRINRPRFTPHTM